MILYKIYKYITFLGNKVDNEKHKESKKLPLSKKQRKKLRKEQSKLENSVNCVSNKNTKDLNKKQQNKNNSNNKSTSKTVTKDNSNESKGNSKSEGVRSGGSSNTEIQFQMLRLPPGITITKVEGPTVTRKLTLTEVKYHPFPFIIPFISFIMFCRYLFIYIYFSEFDECLHYKYEYSFGF